MSLVRDPPCLPIIDLSPLNAGDPWRDHVCAQLDWAASEFGFFYVTGHGVEPEVIHSLLQLSRSFFLMPAQVKQRIHMSHGGRAWRGYFPVGAELTSGWPDLKEGLYFGAELPDDDERVRAGVPLHGRNLFPELHDFRSATLEYMQALTGLGHRLMGCIARALRLGDGYFVDRFTGNPTTLFRIFSYPPAPPGWSFDARGVGEHTDYGLLTLVCQDEVGGLQVQHDSSWIDVPYVADSFVVNVGDMLERLTNARYISAVHRVINRTQRSRISMPFFFDPGFDARLQPIAGVAPALSRERAARWDGLDLRDVRGTYGEYLLGKVSKVFPALGQAHLQDRAPGGSISRG